MLQSANSLKIKDFQNRRREKKTKKEKHRAKKSYHFSSQYVLSPHEDLYCLKRENYLQSTGAQVEYSCAELNFIQRERTGGRQTDTGIEKLFE